MTTTKERVAVAAGRATRRIGLTLPGIVGPLLIAAGFWMLAPWIGVVVLGVLLLAVDLKVGT